MTAAGEPRRRLRRAAGASVLVAGLGLLGACHVPPERAPRQLALDLPPSWSSRTAATPDAVQGAAQDAAPGEDWWAEFADDTARSLVLEALAGNPDLAATGARLLQAVAAAELQASEGQLAATLGLDAARVKTNFIGFPFVPGVPVSRTTTYQLFLDIRWEADIWGRLAAGQQAALSEVAASAAELGGARLSLVGATLLAWYGLVEARAQRELAEQTLAAWDESGTLIARRHRSGLRPAVERRTVAASRAAAAAALCERQRLEQEAARSLEVLLGRYPAAELAAARPLPAIRGQVPAGLPVELLRRRPDLLAAEARLRAAELRVDEARADFSPRLTLGGSVGTRGEHAADLLDRDYSVWSLLGGVAQPLLDGGLLQARWEGAGARAQEALAGFRATLLAAMAETETRLAAEQWLAAAEQQLSRAATEAQAVLELAEQRYRSGLGNRLALLDSLRAAQQAASELLSLRFARVRNRIELHLALGGGFDAGSDEPAPAVESAGSPGG